MCSVQRAACSVQRTRSGASGFSKNSGKQCRTFGIRGDRKRMHANGAKAGFLALRGNLPGGKSLPEVPHRLAILSAIVREHIDNNQSAIFLERLMNRL